ncbi:MAG: hypothetical protein DID90_2727554083 [Candidatus Nitrotoga sp. LAW]|nr:MAG: hypothetical protein DID90_2727554083 [Candidatus Nitrotoga sp. LAW]
MPPLQFNCTAYDLCAKRTVPYPCLRVELPEVKLKVSRILLIKIKYNRMLFLIV